MSQISANHLTLEYESFGPARAPAVLLIMGLGAQLTRWPLEVCDALVDRGYRAIRFDNRDCGLSSKLDGAKIPDLGAALRSGTPISAPYTLDDMATDSVALLAALDIAKAHIVGASMGASIAQLVAAGHPERTLSLTSIMSSSGNPLLPPPTPAAAMGLFAPLPATRDRESMVADAIRRYRVFASPGYPPEASRLRAMLESEFDRCFYPQGVARQLAALLVNGDRRSHLRTITAPTVVLHGADDPLIRVECGSDVAANIPGAEMRVIAGMGHDFPVALATTFADAVDAAARRNLR
jgi:pimeloyl-ACP methyl ester carboxylesterase